MNNNRYTVMLENFNGPLDLLLNMIREHEMNIFDIDLTILTKQYLDFIQGTSELNIELASEYLVMAAYLIEIKSKSLLPREEVNVDGTYEQDNRDQLIARLLEYKKIKEVTKEFRELKEHADQFISKPKSIVKTPKGAIKDLPLSPDLNIDKLANAFMKMLEQISASQPIESNIVRSKVQPEEMQERILNVLKTRPDHKWPLEVVLAKFNPDLTIIVASFIAILDLSRYQKILIDQENNWDDIYLKYLLN